MLSMQTRLRCLSQQSVLYPAIFHVFTCQSVDEWCFTKKDAPWSGSSILIIRRTIFFSFRILSQIYEYIVRLYLLLFFAANSLRCISETALSPPSVVDLKLPKWEPETDGNSKRLWTWTSRRKGVWWWTPMHRKPEIYNICSAADRSNGACKKRRLPIFRDGEIILNGNYLHRCSPVRSCNQC